MTTNTHGETSIEALDSELTARVTDLVDRGLHDAARFSELMLVMKDRPSSLLKYASDGTLSTACDSVIYYAEKLKQLSLCLETSKKIQAITNEQQ